MKPVQGRPVHVPPPDPPPVPPLGLPPDPPSDPPHSAQALFLERQSYRRRRLLDIARLLPLLGVLLLLVPLLWPTGGTGGDTSGALSMSRAITYVFAVWAALILGAVLFGIAARHWGGDDRQSEGRD